MVQTTAEKPFVADPRMAIGEAVIVRGNEKQHSIINSASTHDGRSCLVR